MPVKRFRSVEDMTRVDDRPFDANNLRAAFELARLCFELSGGKRLRAGVYKYPSMAAANEARGRRERG